MTTQYTPILKLALPVTGELSGLWGDVVNENITSMVEQAIAGLATINSWTTNSHTLTTADGTTSESRCAMLVADDDGAGNPSAAATIVCPNATKLYVLKNISGQTVTLKTAAGSGVAVPNNQTAFLFCDGTNVNSAVTTLATGGTVNGDLSVTGNTTLGDSNTDTVTVNAQFNSDLLPSTDNARDLGSLTKSWRNLYLDGTATITTLITNSFNTAQLKASDGTAALSISDSTGAVTFVSTPVLSNGTANQVQYLNGSKQLVGDADMTFDGSNLTLANDATIATLKVGLGAGSVSTNTVVGSDSLTSNTTGSENTAVGKQVLTSNTTGGRNSGYGRYSLNFNTTGFNNSGYGYYTISSNTTGTNNTAVGAYSMLANTTASNNSAFGSESLRLNTTGANNACFGFYTLRANLTGQGSCAFGAEALRSNTTGPYNVAVGYSSLYGNTTGSENVAIGVNSIASSNGTKNTAVGAYVMSQGDPSIGTANTAIGYSALLNIRTGENNVCIGASSGTDAVATITTQSNYVVLGNNSTTNANIKVAWTVTSDARDKTDFGSVPYGLDFVSKLKPTAYKYRKDRMSNEAAEGARTRYGFLAQDILPLEIHGGVIIDETDPENLKFNESSLIPVLVNAIKELKAEVDALKTKLAGA